MYHDDSIIGNDTSDVILYSYKKNMKHKFIALRLIVDRKFKHMQSVQVQAQVYNITTICIILILLPTDNRLQTQVNSITMLYIYTTRAISKDTIVCTIVSSP